jgi:phage tail-like protein
MAEDFDGGVAHSFGLEFDGIQIKSITEVSGLKMEQDVIELKENGPDGKYVIKKLPGKWKVPEIKVVRPLTPDSSFDSWIKDSQFGKGSRKKGGFVIVYNYEGQPIKRYKLTNAWPKSLEISAMKAGDTSVLTESLTVTCERLEVE